MTTLIIHAVVLPITVAKYERSFGTMSRIESLNWTNESRDIREAKTNLHHLNNFDFNEASNSWAMLKNNRILTEHKCDVLSWP